MYSNYRTYYAQGSYSYNYGYVQYERYYDAYYQGYFSKSYYESSYAMRDQIYAHYVNGYTSTASFTRYSSYGDFDGQPIYISESKVGYYSSYYRQDYLDYRAGGLYDSYSTQSTDAYGNSYSTSGGHYYGHTGKV